MDNKVNLRKGFRDKLKSWRDQGAQQIGQADQALAKNLLDLFKTKRGTWAAFKGSRDEPRLETAIRESSHIEWAYPVVTGDIMSFWRPTSEGSFKTGAYGISEPDPEQSQLVDIDDLQGCLIPGVAFDKRGGRLGRGKSYYDRALRNFTGEKVGIAYAAQVSAQPLPMDSWDIYMDALVTEESLLKFASDKEN